MKNLILALVIVLSFSFESALANDIDPNEKTKLKIFKVIKTALSECEINFDKEILARVTFTLNDLGQIVVLKINCEDNEDLKTYIIPRVWYRFGILVTLQV